MDDDRFVVRKVRHRDGRLSHWIFTPAGEVHRPALAVLTRYGTATQETYAYSLVDHLNWLHVNNRGPDSVTFDDLRRYMSGVTGQADGVYGLAWRRPDQKPLGTSAAGNVATVVKAFYLSLQVTGEVRPDLVEALTSGRSFTQHGRSKRSIESNPLAPRKGSRRPRFLPDEIVEALFEPGVLTTARDVMIVTWLHDGGLRVGGLCGLRFCDLHLTRHHPCGQRADPHVHVVGRDDNPNGARAKSYVSASPTRDGYTVDGVIRAVSDDMISTFYAYLLDEFHPIQHLVDHEQILVHLGGATAGAALHTGGVRKVLGRACDRAGLDVRVLPHSFRHKAAAGLYAESDFNAELVAQEFGWSSPAMVTDVYGKSANRHAMKFLQQAWEATARPPAEHYLTPGVTSGAEE
ncbi:tyrosine-type recombinase/integrase [Nocardia sp. NBC_00881]|uniref:tyrosine-type recombinase/integrase n=1 Tax=Nocardia sp. NBC_00881 TaxID=2975995 RepID=UPI0038642377|nr:tyrosine-type recombinase/integrase [Nocardia sp. NBC_00881]WSY62504.1 tyrosine-type recombinase/integrase [Nocardia sp. NBC_00881]